MLEEGEHVKGSCCGHVEHKHKNGLCLGVYWERTSNPEADIAIGCKCKKFEP